MQRILLVLITIHVLLLSLVISGCGTDNISLTGHDKAGVKESMVEKQKDPTATAEPVPSFEYPKPSKLTQSASFDLNSDGKIDKIKFYGEPGGYMYVLRINNSSITDRGENLDGYFRIVDIDSRDGILEISISESGPSDDYQTAFYSYDGKNIVFMGKIQGADHGYFSRNLEIDGSGVLHTVTEGELWNGAYKNKYKLSKNHLLEKIPQDLHSIGLRMRVLRELPLQTSRTNPKTKIVLQPGEIATILASDNKAWYLVENSRGIKGWLAVERFYIVKGTGLGIDKFFERR